MIKFSRFATVLASVLATAVSASWPGAAFSQGSFPDRSVRLVVPFPPGGSTDIVARLIAGKMSEGLGKAVVVENKPGAIGSIGTGEVARSAPDGYSMVFTIATTAVLNPMIMKNLTYDPFKDLQPVAMIAKIPNVLIVNKDIPARNLKELIAWLKANPGKHNYGSSGTGGAMHLSGELFKKQAGIEVTHVPYKGSAPAMQDLMGGTLVFMFDNITGSIGPSKAGQVRLLGVTTDVRVSVLPDVPTIAEAGLPEFKNSSWFSLFTRAGLPAPVLARLEAESLKAINHPDISAKLRELGAIPSPMGAAQLDKFWKADFDYWRPVVQSVKLD